jgi:hypothetical protein
MKTYKIFVILFFIGSKTTYSQINFEKRHSIGHFQSYSQMQCVTQLSNNNYIYGGYEGYTHTPFAFDAADATLLFCDEFGDTIKTYTFFKDDTSYFNQFGGGGVNIFRHCIVNNAKQCIAVASIQGHGATNQYDSDIFIVKLDSLGDTLQTKQISHPIPGDSAMIPYCILQTFDGGYIITGSQNSFTNNRYIGFILKVDTAFNILWRKSFLNPNSNIFFRALESPDHGIFISGYRIDPNDPSNADPVLLKTDSVGHELWRNNYLSLGQDYGGDLVALSDGNFMQVTTKNVGNDTSTYRIIKFTNNGSIITTKNYLKSYANDIQIVTTRNNSIILSGWVENNYATQTVDAFVMGVDINGDSLWYRQYGGIWPDFAWHMAPTNDGGVILCGETYSNLIPNTNSNAWLVKLDSLGLLITGVEEQTWANNVQMNAPFPNPCNTEFKITTSIPEPIKNNGLGKTGNELQLYDLSSKPLQYIPIKEGTVTTTISTANLSSGNYLLVLVVNGYNVASQKVVVIR